MFLDSITLVKTLPCLAEPGKIIVIGKPSETLERVIPYLATLPSVIVYNPATSTLTFRRQPGFLTIYADQAIITQVKNIEEGMELLAALWDAVNAVWEKRDELIPETSSRSAVRPLDLWELLPRSNCGQCGEATCMAYAFLLIQGKKLLRECPILQSDSNFTNQKATLETLI
jgi:ArsR family metal-binding transcriptional regulator